MVPQTAQSLSNYTNLRTLLLPPNTPAPLLPGSSHPSTQRPTPHHPDATAAIASLQLHPVLEVLLHILNGDLTSAHFYVRHMQSPPKYEGMLLHALLHRTEGDLGNSRAWYSDVCGSEVFEYVWSVHLDDGETEEGNTAQLVQPEAVKDDKQPTPEPGSEEARNSSKTLPVVVKFLDDIASLRSTSHKDRTASQDWEAEREKLSAMSKQEVARILEWCERRFGTARWEDASSEFAGSAEKYKEIASKQVVGGEGWRKF